MKKFIIAAIAVAATILFSQKADAQEVRYDWHDIDTLMIYAPMHVSQYKNIYIVPVDEAQVVYDEDHANVNKVKKEVKNFRKYVQKTMTKGCKGLKVSIVDALPENMTDSDLVLNLKYSEFFLGFNSLRFWVGHGAGDARLTIHATVSDKDGNALVSFNHRNVVGSNPFGPGTDCEILRAVEKGTGKRISNLFKYMEKE